MNRQEIYEVYQYMLLQNNDNSHPAEDKISAAIVTLACAINDAGIDISGYLDKLGTNNSDTRMGAIELLASEVNKVAQILESRQ